MFRNDGSIRRREHSSRRRQCIPVSFCLFSSNCTSHKAIECSRLSPERLYCRALYGRNAADTLSRNTDSDFYHVAGRLFERASEYSGCVIAVSTFQTYHFIIWITTIRKASISRAYRQSFENLRKVRPLGNSKILAWIGAASRTITGADALAVFVGCKQPEQTTAVSGISAPQLAQLINAICLCFCSIIFTTFSCN
jgi:hypothetical protein